MRKFILILSGALLCSSITFGQEKDIIVEKIIKEAFENSQLEALGHELMDDIGPRLVGTPQMQQANDWAVAKYKGWGISAENEKWENGRPGKEEGHISIWFIQEFKHCLEHS